MRNKKADVEISLKTLIGFFLVVIIFFAFVGLFVKIWELFQGNPSEATTNSFKNLVYELNTLKEGESKVVPFYIEEGFYLYTECETTVNEYGLNGASILNDICICRETCQKKRLSREIITWIKDKTQKVEIPGSYITSKGVRNIVIERNQRGAMIQPK